MMKLNTFINNRYYKENGYLVIRKLFSVDECQQMKVESERLLTSLDLRYNNLRTEMWNRNGEDVISKIDPVVDISNLFSNIAQCSRIQDIVTEIFGENGILFKDKIIYKLPEHAGFGAHQDITWYRGFPEEILAVVIAIDEATENSGAIQVAPQAHDLNNPVPVGEIRDLYDSEIPSDCVWKTLLMNPGDVLILSSKIPHRSPPNKSTFPRRALFLSYTPKKYGDLYCKYYKSREKILRSGMGETQGNFNIPIEHRRRAEFFPKIEHKRGNIQKKSHTEDIPQLQALVQAGYNSGDPLPLKSTDEIIAMAKKKYNH